MLCFTEKESNGNNTKCLLCADTRLHIPTKDPALRPSIPAITRLRPYAAGNLLTLYSAKTRGRGTWIKLLVNPRYPLIMAIVMKSSNETKTETKKKIP
jgi:hypothetical protein